MTMKILVNYDFCQNQILNASMQKLATAPSNPFISQQYYNTALNRAFYWNGTEWVGMDAEDAVLTGSEIVSAINDSNAKINVANLHSSVADAINAAHSESHTLSSHSDVTITSIASGEILKWDGSKWINNTLAEAGIASTATFTTTADGLVPKTTTSNTTDFLRRDGTWATPPNTATATDDIFDGSNTGTAILYKPYTAQQAKLSFDTSSTTPIRNDRLNLNGYLYATKLFVGDTEVSLVGHTHAYSADDHVHGNITNAGAIGSTAGLMIKTTTSGVLTTLAAGSSGQFLQYDGTWATPPNTATAVDDILDASNTGTAITYKPYVSQQAKLSFDTSSTAPDRTDRLNLNGYLYATKLYSGGTEVSVSGHTHAYSSNTHVHGNITNDGKIGTVANRILITGNGGLVTTLAAGTSGEYLQYDGSWSIPPNTITTVKGTDGTAVSGEVLIKGTAPISTTQSGQDITITHSTSDGYKHVPANGTTNSGKVLTAGATAGSYTWETPTVAWGNVSGAPTNAHDQNTDTGTNNSTFQLDNDANGVKLKNVSGVLEVRNAADNDYADLKVNNLTVNGTTTTINSNEVNIGDSILLLNSDITTSTSNSDGGIAVKRLMADNVTRKDAELTYDVSSNRWETTFGAVTGTLVTAQIANKVTAVIGDGLAYSYVVTHNFNTRDCAVGIRETVSPYAAVMCDWEFTSENTITFKFASPPTNNQYTVTIVG